jgi:hypothetical protein
MEADKEGEEVTEYRWKAGSRCRADANAAGKVCASLERKGRLTPSALVEASRPEDAPLHGEFEWDDAVAAERYRENQAGYIIRSVEVVVQGVEQPVRAFVSVDVEGGGKVYEDVLAVVQNATKSAALLREAKAELASFRRKYKALEELAEVFAAIDRVA